MASNIQATKKDDYIKFFNDYKKRHSTDGSKKVSTFTQSFGNGEFLQKTILDDGNCFYLEKRHVKEMAGVQLNCLDFTLEIPMIKYEYWTSDMPQRRCYYEKEK